jgi:hypothetical protein
MDNRHIINLAMQHEAHSNWQHNKSEDSNIVSQDQHESTGSISARRSFRPPPPPPSTSR